MYQRILTRQNFDERVAIFEMKPSVYLIVEMVMESRTIFQRVFTLHLLNYSNPSIEYVLLIKNNK